MLKSHGRIKKYQAIEFYVGCHCKIVDQEFSNAVIWYTGTRDSFYYTFAKNCPETAIYIGKQRFGDIQRKTARIMGNQ